MQLRAIIRCDGMAMIERGGVHRKGGVRIEDHQVGVQTDRDGARTIPAPAPGRRPRAHIRYSSWCRSAASVRVGGRAAAASDDFFAPRASLLEPEPAAFVPGKFTSRGKWMDGWESLSLARVRKGAPCRTCA